MSKFDLRDISQRLTTSRDTEAVVFEFLGYLQSARSDWRASLAFYEVSQDSLVNVFTRQGPRLARRDVVVPVDQLPARLVRKFFHPTAFFNPTDRRTLLSHMFQASPFYEPDPLEAKALNALCPTPGWNSCVCLPLADQDNMLALLTVVSDRRGAFGLATMSEIIPLTSMAALALAQRLYQSSHRLEPNGATSDERSRVAAADFQDRIRRLNLQTAELSEENRAKSAKLQALTQEVRNSSESLQELARVKGELSSLEERSASALENLAAASTQLDNAQVTVTELLRTIGFIKEALQLLSLQHDGDDFARTIVPWFCETFGVDRCSLMQLDESNETLHVRAHRGLDDKVAGAVRVRMGQGIAGWVAHNRKPLFVRVPEEGHDVPYNTVETYNSNSFISVPLIYNDQLVGVLNFSNKRDGQPFNELDLDRAVLAGSVLAVTLSGHRASQPRARAA